MKRIQLLAVAVVLFMASLLAQPAFAHCQVPCGIYDDKARINLMGEDVTTIEKAMKEITALSAASPANYNQIVRWVNTKEQHADKLMHTVADYWMTQRLKLADPKDEAATEKYITQLTTLHHILVYAMKSKQTTDLQNVETLRQLLHGFSHQYFGEEAAARKLAPCPRGEQCPHGKECPHGEACEHANVCPGGEKCPHSDEECPHGKTCPHK